MNIATKPPRRLRLAPVENAHGLGLARPALAVGLATAANEFRFEQMCAGIGKFKPNEHVVVATGSIRPRINTSASGR